MPRRTKRVKEIQRVLRGAGLIFVSIAFLVAFFFFASWVAGETRQSIESRIRERIVSRIVEEAGIPEEELAEGINEKLLSLNFTDIFSGVGWINRNETTLYHDEDGDAFTLPPQGDGFDKSEPREVVSVSVKRHPVQVWRAMIAEAGVSGSGADVEFYLSNDGVTWHEVEVGEWIIFPTKEHQLFWKVRFLPDRNPATSPVFNHVKLHYQASFL